MNTSIGVFYSVTIDSKKLLPRPGAAVPKTKHALLIERNMHLKRAAKNEKHNNHIETVTNYHISWVDTSQWIQHQKSFINTPDHMFEHLLNHQENMSVQ